MRPEEVDPKGLIRESYRIEGITPAECRSIFLDWALSLPDGIDQREGLRCLLSAYAEGRADHPMTAVMSEGLTGSTSARRRGGRAGRLGTPGR